jgi:hypothetical protein
MLYLLIYINLFFFRFSRIDHHLTEKDVFSSQQKLSLLGEKGRLWRFIESKMKITVRTMQHNSETKVIEVSSGLSVKELRKKCAQAFFCSPSENSPSSSFNMFLRGAALNDEDERVSIKPGDTILVNFHPVSSSARGQQHTKLKAAAKISSSSSLNLLQRTLIRNRNKKGRGLCNLLSPNAARLLIAICSTNVIKFMSVMVIWCYLAKIAVKYELGPIFVLCSLFYLMFTNLSTATNNNKDGKLSAYSLFNKNFETLPGNFDAIAVERNVRHNHEND